MPRKNKRYITGAKRYDIFREIVKANYGGLLKDVTEIMLRDLFDTYDEAAEFFGVTRVTLSNWRRSGHWPVMPLRLLLIMHRGYLPSTNDWAGCHIEKIPNTDPKKPPEHLLFIPGYRTGFRPEDVRWHIMLKERYELLEAKEKQAEKAKSDAKERRGKFTVITGGKLWNIK